MGCADETRRREGHSCVLMRPMMHVAMRCVYESVCVEVWMFCRKERKCGIENAPHLNHLVVKLFVPDGRLEARVVRGQDEQGGLLGPGSHLLEEVHLQQIDQHRSFVRRRCRWFGFPEIDSEYDREDGRTGDDLCPLSVGSEVMVATGACWAHAGRAGRIAVFLFSLRLRACLSGRWYTPLKRSPLPMGQLTAYVCSLNSFSIWSHSSSGGSDGRSILFAKVKIGKPLIRHTSKSLRVCGSRPAGVRVRGRAAMRGA